MPETDLSPAELAAYRIVTPEPEGLDSWWAEQVAAAEALSRPPEIVPYRPEVYGPLPVWDLTFSGAGGDPIRGWYLRPPGSRADEPLPTVVSFVGYGGGRGTPAEHALLPSVGFATVVMDARGQGGGFTVGATGDPGRTGDGPEHPGVMTRGLAAPESYYLTRLYVDAVRAVRVAAALPGVDADRLGVSGASQGGGLALAAAGLCGERVHACQADVPFLCDFRRAVRIADTRPYTEIADFLSRHDELVDTAYRTLAYVDAALLARRITAPTLIAVGLMDPVCPPSTVYAAYHEVRAPKELAVYPFGRHQPPPVQEERRLSFLRRHLAGWPDRGP